uniref:LIM zinc-binding domain-containing protein n=1 Tax=Ditylenchus dipsaci TaxID=166011 RepID=A0A915CSD7_9BILA
MLLCWRDYIRLFGASGQCSLCLQSIGASEWIMKAGQGVYHLQCFACQQCNSRFCVGDQFHMQNGRIYCEDDFKLLS